MATKATKNSGQQSAGIDQEKLKEAYAKALAVYDNFEQELDKIRREKNRLLAEIEKRINDKKIQEALARAK